MLSKLSAWFWQERLWFPEGLGWADLEDRDGRVYAKATDLWVALPIALLFLIVRQVFERSVCVLPCVCVCVCASVCVCLSQCHQRCHFTGLVKSRDSEHLFQTRQFFSS